MAYTVIFFKHSGHTTFALIFYIKLSLEFCVSFLCYIYFLKIILLQSIVVASREGWDGLKDYLMYITSTELFRFSR